MKIDFKRSYNFDAQILFSLVCLTLLYGSYLLALHAAADIAVSMDVVIVKTIIHFVASFAVIIAFVTFATDYVPAVRVTEVKNNQEKNLIYYKIQNFSKTLIKNMVIHHILFDIPIKDGKESSENEINLFLFNLSGEKGYVGPTSTQEYVLNLNRVKTSPPKDAKVTLDTFTHHTFLLVTLRFKFWFWPFKDFRIRGVAYHDRENKEWFTGSEEHPELASLFKILFVSLEKDDKKKLDQIMNATIDRAKASWGVLFQKTGE
jgi:hypothetical protein